MKHIYADDGRILTSPKELKPLLKDSFVAFLKILGHIRFFYISDEIWDGKSSLIFNADGKELVAITLDNGAFNVQIANEKFRITNEILLDAVYKELKNSATDSQRRPFEQLTVNLNDPDEIPCGYRCDLCLGSKKSDITNYSESENFGYMNWLCYHNCVEGIEIERFDGVWNCPGCAETRKMKVCRLSSCNKAMENTNCAECGEYHSCVVLRNSHYPGQCNLGLTAEEITSLVIPYCVKERLDTFRKQIL